MRSSISGIILGFVLMAAVQVAAAEKKNGPGVTDSEIKLGQTIAYSGPVSALGMEGVITSAYFNMINAKGGINGHKIKFISLDDGFSPAKTVEQVRVLVEGEGVMAVIGSVGSGPNLAVAKYMSTSQLPHLLISAGR